MKQRNITSGDLFSETEAALNWMVLKGIDAPKIRYSRYINYIRDFFQCKSPGSPEGLEKFKLATKSFKELMIIINIYHSFENEDQLGFIDRLKKAVTGQDHPSPGSAGSSRDFLFELYTASMFFDAGYSIDFGEKTDVIARNERSQVYIECKRLSSEKKFEGNFKYAGKQLKEGIERIRGSVHGMIFIEITDCLQNLPTRQLTSIGEAKKIVYECLEGFLKEKINKIEEINDRFVEQSLGVCLFAIAPIWIDDASFYLTRHFHCHVAQKLTHERFDVLEAIMENIKSSYN